MGPGRGNSSNVQLGKHPGQGENVRAPRELGTLGLQVGAKALLAQLQLLQQVRQHVLHHLAAGAHGHHVLRLHRRRDDLQLGEGRGSRNAESQLPKQAAREVPGMQRWPPLQWVGLQLQAACGVFGRRQRGGRWVTLM